MTAYWHTLANVTIPVLIAVLWGAAVGRWRNVDLRTLSSISIFILAPAMVLYTLVDGGGSAGEVGRIALFTIVDMVVLWIFTALLGKILRVGRPVQSAWTMTTLFSNSVNYGLPVILLAFGQSGFTRATVYVIGQIFLMYTVGVYVSSRAEHNAGGAWRQVWRTPVLYAAVVAGALALLHLHWPHSVDTSFRVIGIAYPSIVLLILGMQLGRVNWQGLARKELWVAVVLRLLVAPFIALAVLQVLHIHGLLASVLFVEASMPAASNTAVFVEQFGGDRALVAMTVAVTTIISFLVLPLEVMLSLHR